MLFDAPKTATVLGEFGTPLDQFNGLLKLESTEEIFQIVVWPRARPLIEISNKKAQNLQTAPTRRNKTFSFIEELSCTFLLEGILKIQTGLVKPFTISIVGA